MQLTISKSDLVPALSLVAGVAAKHTTIPVLSMVKLSAANDRLNLTGTDLENAITCGADCHVSQPGEICLPAKRLLDYVRLLDGDITIKTAENNWANVSAGRSRSRIAGESPESFPELPAPAGEAVSVDARAFGRILQRVTYAVSEEESRFTLKGALVEFGGDGLRAVGTDGSRLAYTLLPGQYFPPMTFIFPKKAMGEYAKLADGAEGGAKAEIAADDNHIFFSVGGRRLVARKLAGSFPDWKRVVLQQYENGFNASRDELKAAIQRVSQFSAPDTKTTSGTVALTFANGSLEVSASDIAAGESDEAITCPYNGPEVKMGMSPEFLTEFLSAVETEQVLVMVKDANHALELRPAEYGENFRYIAMPKRL